MFQAFLEYQLRISRLYCNVVSDVLLIIIQQVLLAKDHPDYSQQPTQRRGIINL